jgi:hypothetical protein
VLRENIDTQDPQLRLNKINIGTLPEIVQRFEWVTDLYISDCNIVSLDNLPPNITLLDASNNLLKSVLPNQLPISLKRMSLARNKLEELYNLNENLEELIIDGNIKLADNFILPNNIIQADLSNCSITKRPQGAPNLKVLKISRNKISSIDDFHETLLELDCSINEIVIIKNPPPKLIALSAYYNKIKFVVKLPEDIQTLDLSNNELCWISKFPDKIKSVDLANNNLKDIKPLPDSLEELDIRQNKFTRLPPEIKNDKRVTCDEENEEESIWGNQQNGQSNNGNAWQHMMNSNSIEQWRRMIQERHEATNQTNSTVRVKYSKKNPNYIVHTKRITL